MEGRAMVMVMRWRVMAELSCDGSVVCRVVRMV